MASSVDFPQPDGPEIERYSPFLTSKWMLWRACVSTSSVTKTLLTLSSRISGCEPLSMVIYPFYENCACLVQLNSIVTVIRRHVRQNHLVPNLQAILDLDASHRTLSQLHLHLVSISPVRLQFEKGRRAVLLPEHWPAHVHHIAQSCQLDGAIHAQVGTRVLWKSVFSNDQRHVHGHRPIQNGRIDARYPAFNKTITRIDDRVLTDGDIFYLCFGDLQLGLQLGGLRHLAQRRTSRHAQAFLDTRL